MALYAISDLHLCGAEGDKKSMDVFGRRWIGGKEKLSKNWTKLITADDSVIIPGDITWAMTLEEARDDFEFINSLPGTKIIGKGNHDFWWTTSSKMNKFFSDTSLDTIKILYNNYHFTQGVVVCGSRGWFSEEANQKTVGDVDWQKIVARETQRLALSIDSVPEEYRNFEKIAFLHFPPVWKDSICKGIIEILKNNNVARCYYGHIHGVYASDCNFEYDGIRFNIISADYLDFCPLKIL